MKTREALLMSTRTYVFEEKQEKYEQFLVVRSALSIYHYST